MEINGKHTVMCISDYRQGSNWYLDLLTTYRSQDSSVDIATGYGLDDHGGREFESQQGQKFSLLHIVQTGSGVHPTSYKMGTGGKAAEA
jgi:hypothetical protein